MKRVPPAFRIYQAELSSYCNMKCTYCPHPTMRRPKGYMPAPVLEAIISHLKAMGQSHLVLHHFGEPLLHPSLTVYLEELHRAGLSAQLSTNGLLLERTLPRLLQSNVSLTVMLAFHQWRDDVREYQVALAKYQALTSGTNVTVIPSYALKNGNFAIHQWTNGHFEVWDVAECPFIKYNLAVVLWNGDIASCCVDHEGVTVLGNILDPQSMSRVTRPWVACSTCDVGRLMRGETY